MRRVGVAVALVLAILIIGFIGVHIYSGGRASDGVEVGVNGFEVEQVGMNRDPQSGNVYIHIAILSFENPSSGEVVVDLSDLEASVGDYSLGVVNPSHSKTVEEGETVYFQIYFSPSGSFLSDIQASEITFELSGKATFSSDYLWVHKTKTSQFSLSHKMVLDLDNSKIG